MTGLGAFIAKRERAADHPAKQRKIEKDEERILAEERKVLEACRLKPEFLPPERG